MSIRQSHKATEQWNCTDLQSIPWLLMVAHLCIAIPSLLQHSLYAWKWSLGLKKKKISSMNTGGTIVPSTLKYGCAVLTHRLWRRTVCKGISSSYWYILLVVNIRKLTITPANGAPGPFSFFPASGSVTTALQTKIVAISAVHSSLVQVSLGFQRVNTHAGSS